MDEKKTKYIIGIDLGTTNCALAYIETPASKDDRFEVKSFAIPQLTGPGAVEERPVLPSFIYMATDVEFPKGSLDLPWAAGRGFAVGEFARKRGAESPKRLISSAKSWLCHSGVSREEKILPWGGDEDCPKFSPIEASAKYLEHMKDAWNHKMAKDAPASAMEKQTVFLTVPASFDAIARDLTLKAAYMTGLKNVTLLEEPQAAFYSWLNGLGDGWRREVKEGDVILVFDVGGGTTDFSLIAVGSQGGELSLNRIAVGNHILLGGDNMDVALANMVRTKLEESGRKIDPWQFQALWYSARTAKEEILSGAAKDRVPVAVLSRGKSVIGGSIKSEVLKSEVDSILVEGFFPKSARPEMPQKQSRAGIMELGLPYASDPAVTRHLAKFLAEHVGNDNYKKTEGATFVHPSAVLFNGGVMKAKALQERALGVLEGWIEAEKGRKIKLLTASDMDLAVARGAAYFGMAKAGSGIRIRGGAARSYYIGLETSMPAIPGMRAPMKALCVVPAKTEEGTVLAIPGREFGLRVGEQSEFKMFASTVHKAEPPGSILDEWGDELTEMPPLETVLESKEGEEGSIIPVKLESHVTEIGTVELWCVSRDDKKRWKLEFNIRENE